MVHRLYAIDPGPTLSAVAILGYDDAFIRSHVYRTAKLPNDEMLHLLHEQTGMQLVIEQIESMGMAVGASVFETCFWSGRFAEAWDGPWDRVTRRQVKLMLCGQSRAKDANIRQALLDRFGGKDVAIGKKAAPGPLFGVSGDCWSALAVGVTWLDLQRGLS